MGEGKPFQTNRVQEGVGRRRVSDRRGNQHLVNWGREVNYGPSVLWRRWGVLVIEGGGNGEILGERLRFVGRWGPEKRRGRVGTPPLKRTFDVPRKANDKRYHLNSAT